MFVRKAKCALFPSRHAACSSPLPPGPRARVVLGIPAQRLHAALPFLDAAPTSYSLVGSWWQARQHIANWWLWIVVDLIYIGEYVYKDLWLTAILYAGLVVLAVIGLRDWQRAARSHDRLDRGLNHIPQRLALHIAAQLIRRNLHRARMKTAAWTLPHAA